MRKNINLKSNKNNNNKIINKSNKKIENKKQENEVNDINKEINQGVKLTVGNKLLEMEKSQQKVLELEKIIESQNAKIKILNQGVEPYNIQIQNLNNKIAELMNENNNLKQNDLRKNEEIERLKNDLRKNEEIERLKNQLNDESKIKNELIESNKKLQEKIELLNHQIESIKFNNKKEQEEYNSMCKVKNNFEDRTIQLTEELQKIQTKLQIAENALKQKDKYIQMLINKKIII